MKKGWTTIKLITVGSVCALDFTISIFASIISIVTATPLASGAITAFVGTILPLVVFLLVGQVGTFTLYELLYTILCLPTFIWGPPGFFPKVLIGVTMGIVADILYLVFGKINRSFAFVLVALDISLFGTFLFVQLAYLFKIPGAEKTAWFISSPVLILAFVGVAVFNTFIAQTIYRKIQDTAVVRRIQQ